MTNKAPFNSLLVPTDFSENAWSAFQHARLLVDGEDSEIVVVHVIDPSIIDHVVELICVDRLITCYRCICIAAAAVASLSDPAILLTL